MLFITLNDGRKLNMLTIYQITTDGKDVIYLEARGSLNVTKEHFESEAEAENRYKELQDKLSVIVK